MKTAEVRFKNALICNSVNLNNGRYILLGSIDEITKVSVDITAKVQQGGKTNMEQNILKRYNEIHIMLWEEVLKVFSVRTNEPI